MRSQLLPLLLCLAACTGAADEASLTGDAGAPPSDAPIDDDGGLVDGASPVDGATSTDAGSASCKLGQRSCNGTGRQRECRDVAGSPTWVETACPELQYCIEDRCVDACLDECSLGATRTSGGTLETCKIYSASTKKFVAPSTGGHDLARRHLAWLRARHLANGYVANTLFVNKTWTTPIQYTGTVDAAEWTGVYLAAESLRALATHAPDATRNVDAIIERVHQLFEITGTPGYMARVWAPRTGDPLLAALYVPSDWSHHAVTYGGGPAFYQAWTSLDMYQGVVPALGLAFDATSSSKHRDMIRNIVVTLVRETIRKRTGVPVRVRYNALGGWQETDLTFDLENVVLVPNEMVGGRVFIQVGTDAAPSDYSASELRGARELFPDFQVVLKQVPLIGPLVPSIPRSGTAIMLANLMELALHVTEGVPGTEADRTAFRAYYDANVASWLGIMKQYAYHHTDNCWQQYFGLALVHHATYGLLRSTKDASLAAAIRKDVLGAKIRPYVAGHQNVYFDLIAASQAPGLVPASELKTTLEQLVQFVPPPKASVPVDNTGKYPGNASCPNQSTKAVAISGRVPMDFAWQHHPFRLKNEFVDERHVYPGTDYLIGYWLARHHGLLADDAPNTCTRWSP